MTSPAARTTLPAATNTFTRREAKALSRIFGKAGCYFLGDGVRSEETSSVHLGGNERLSRADHRCRRRHAAPPASLAEILYLMVKTPCMPGFDRSAGRVAWYDTLPR
jgi:hypothetical protein